jgi:hypothetical protein
MDVGLTSTSLFVGTLAGANSFSVDESLFGKTTDLRAEKKVEKFNLHVQSSADMRTTDIRKILIFGQF